MPVRLRGHHFLCMLTYKGLGYSQAFIENMSAKIAQISLGAPVELVIGKDDICAGMSKTCSHASGHDCNSKEILTMDKTARRSVEAVLNRDLGVLAPLTKPELDRLRAAFTTGTIRQACAGCSWFEVCSQIVGDQFSQTHLLDTPL